MISFRTKEEIEKEEVERIPEDYRQDIVLSSKFKEKIAKLYEEEQKKEVDYYENTKVILLEHKSLPERRQFISEDELKKVVDIDSFIGIVDTSLKNFKTEDEQNKHKGDMFEIFCEFFLKKFGDDKNIRISNYQPNAHCDPLYDLPDHGVDGRGKSNGKNVAIQAKYYPYVKALSLNKAHLGNFTSEATNPSYEYCVDGRENLRLLTFALDVSSEVRVHMNGGLVIGLNQFKSVIGSENKDFWLQFAKSWEVSQPLVARSLYELKPHQLRMVEAARGLLNSLDKHRGWIGCGTGGGKTLVIKVLAEEFASLVVIAAPRISLVEQIKNVIWKQKSIGCNYDRLTFHSGGKEEMLFFKGDAIFNQQSTTDATKLADFIRKPGKKIIFTTYHSSRRLGETLRSEGINDWLYLADECHNLVSTEFSSLLKKKGELEPLDFKKFIGFTGTAKEQKDPNGYGMNNKVTWGDCICEVTPAELAQIGITVPPRMYFVNVNDAALATQLNYDIVNKAIRSFKDGLYSTSDCKIIVTCPSVEVAHEMCSEGILSNLDDFEKFVITSSRKMGARTRDGELKKFSQAKNALLFHYDMIGEGIDVPAVSGVLMLRGLNNIKIIQNIGRANRLNDEDKKRLGLGEIEILNRDQWSKPYAWVITPYVKSDPLSCDAYNNTLRVLYKLRKQEFDFLAEEYIYVADSEGEGGDAEFDQAKQDEEAKKEKLREEIEEKVLKDFELLQEDEMKAKEMLKKCYVKSFASAEYSLPEGDDKYLNEKCQTKDPFKF